MDFKVNCKHYELIGYVLEFGSFFTPFYKKVLSHNSYFQIKQNLGLQAPVSVLDGIPNKRTAKDFSSFYLDFRHLGHFLRRLFYINPLKMCRANISVFSKKKPNQYCTNLIRKNNKNISYCSSNNKTMLQEEKLCPSCRSETHQTSHLEMSGWYGRVLTTPHLVN